MCSFLDVCTNSVTIRVGIIYIRPGTNSTTIQQLIKDIQAGTQNRTSLLLGDFNMRHQEWGDTVTSAHANRLLSFCKDNNFAVLNKTDAFGKPTHGNSIIDLALSNKPSLFSLKLCAV